MSCAICESGMRHRRRKSIAKKVLRWQLHQDMGQVSMFQMLHYIMAKKHGPFLCTVLKIDDTFETHQQYVCQARSSSFLIESSAMSPEANL